MEVRVVKAVFTGGLSRTWDHASGSCRARGSAQPNSKRGVLARLAAIVPKPSNVYEAWWATGNSGSSDFR